eukprot:CAMPEP_0116008158 /NCGR_PEP_ID=MMETSP0321-20121206/2705_1 /TAXON_ID=163516 /ORGANISM="Leptocylindrus danicus var. danicus, Strain B650" /LENGTH=578 /DNA_ID=CAMNT_0003476945 /DNA_START=89 /DNA_END=1825 /DNA_ORIENTATION=-
MEQQARQTVVCLLPNCPFFVCCWIGLVKVGMTAALVNTNLRGKSLAHAMEVAFQSNEHEHENGFDDSNSNKNVVIVDASLMQILSNDEVVCRMMELHRVEVFVYGYDATVVVENERSRRYKNLQTLLNTSPNTDPNCPSTRRWHDDNEAMLYIYTSGTTGYPKAAKISHNRYIRAGALLPSLARLKSGRDVLYAPLPLYHSNAGMIAVGACIIAGVPLVIRNKFSVTNFASDIARFRCTVFIYIGDLARYIVNSNRLEDQNVCQTLRVAIGNGMRPDVWSVFQSRYNIDRVIEFYSSTEGMTMFNTCGIVGAIGFIPPLLRGVSPASLVKVNEVGEVERDPATGMAIVSKVGEPGQMLAKISERKRFDGYTDKAATQKKILHDVLAKGDRWFATGDLIRESETERGVYFWVDRLGDTFRWKGENVSTTEVEHILITASDDIIDVAVYGVEIPNQSDGKAGMGYITLCCKHKNFDLVAFYENISTQLQTYAVPLFLRVATEAETDDHKSSESSSLEENNAMTSTFKKKKAMFRKDGFDPKKISMQGGEEGLYFFDKGKRKYVDLTDAIYNMICRGEIRL